MQRFHHQQLSAACLRAWGNIQETKNKIDIMQNLFWYYALFTIIYVILCRKLSTIMYLVVALQHVVIVAIGTNLSWLRIHGQARIVLTGILGDKGGRVCKGCLLLMERQTCWSWLACSSVSPGSSKAESVLQWKLFIVIMHVWEA